MIKQRKRKYKKNFDKRFHRNIHEFAESRPQKKKKKKCKSFLLNSIRDIKHEQEQLLELPLVKSTAFPEAFVRRCS